MDLSLKYLSYGLLVALVIKSIIAGASPSDVGIIFTVSSLALILSYIEKHKKIQEIVETVNEQNKVIKKLAEELDHQRTALAGVKMGVGFQKVR